MIKVEVIEEFTLKEFDKLEEIVRKSKDEKGKLFVGDIFKCDKKMFDYLNGNNKLNKKVVIPIGVDIEKIQIETIEEVSNEDKLTKNEVKEYKKKNKKK